MHHADAQFHCGVGIVDVDGLAVEFDGAFKATGGVDDRHTEEDVHQRGFTSAVFTHEGVDFAALYFQLNALEDAVAVVFLGDTLHF